MPTSEKFEAFLGEEVVDSDGETIGTFACYWEQTPGKPVLLGIDITGSPVRTHVVPAKGARLSEKQSYVQVLFNKRTVREAPWLDCGDELNPELEQAVWSYYGSSAGDPFAGAQNGHSFRRVSKSD